MDATFNAGIKDVLYQIQQGLITFNATAATACLQASQQEFASCDVLIADLDTQGSSTTLSPCKDVLQGNLPLGAPCANNAVCMPTTICTLPPGATDNINRCTRTAGVGEDCSKFPCRDGATCSTMGTTKTCVAPVMTGNQGDPCDSMPPTPPAMSLPPCRAPFVCLPANTCGLAQDGGASCNGASTNNPQCLSGICDRMSCVQPMTKPKTLRDSICM
jgi:hypothetical protein